MTQKKRHPLFVLFYNEKMIHFLIFMFDETGK